MYGLAPANDDPFKDDLRPAMKFVSYVAGVREAVPGESVGYGRTWSPIELTRIAIVPIGYADGVRRALSNRGDVLVAGRRCPIMGRISMDQLDGAPARRSGAARRRGRPLRRRRRRGRRPAATVAWTSPDGPRHDAPERRAILCEEMAQLGTINYEVACDVAPRVTRAAIAASPPAA